jgi:hypothetical protein
MHIDERSQLLDLRPWTDAVRHTVAIGALKR